MKMICNIFWRLYNGFIISFFSFVVQYLVYLHSLWFTHKQFHRIFSQNKNYQDFYQRLSLQTWEEFGIDAKKMQKYLEAKQDLDTHKIDTLIQRLWVQVILFDDENYPSSLKHISNPPYFLYVRGNISAQDDFFSIVGSRKLSVYAKKSWEHLIPDLSKHFTIVSGWAWWCDTLAHDLALKNGWKTIVVFGTGIDVTYPVSNHDMFERVVELRWALISIFPIGTLWNFYTFPIRNEIVAGLSRGLLVLQAGEKSWTLITARLALDQWKDVFAVPGDIFSPYFIGSNALIKDSQAKLVSMSLDILSEYWIHTSMAEKKEIIFENDMQKDIFMLLKHHLALNIDEILEKTSYDYQTLSTQLFMMEISKLIKKNHFWKYEL